MGTNFFDNFDELYYIGYDQRCIKIDLSIITRSLFSQQERDLGDVFVFKPTKHREFISSDEKCTESIDEFEIFKF